MGKLKYIVILVTCLFTTSTIADNNTNCTNSQDCYNSGVYIYEGGQDLVDIYDATGTTNLNSGDDNWSNQVSLGMEWDRWGQTWSHARMSTNGCVNFTSGSAGGSSSNCQDYTPQSLPYRDYTLYAFWTDLIRGTATLDDGSTKTSKMRFKDFGSYVVFGWYYMKEYNIASSNSFEAILYENNSFEYRYRELDIIQHDVLIGEQGNNSTTPADTKTFLFYNDGQSGYNTLDAYLANSGWPDLENGGSLYGGTETQMCAISALYSTECSGYAAAYLTQQCAISALYNSACTGYAAAYLSQQCGLNTLYSESCTGYAAAYLTYECNIDVFYASSCDGYASALAQEEALYDAIYGTDEDMYGYSNEESEYGYDEYGNAYGEEDLWYDEEYGEYLDPNDPCYENGFENMTDADWYALDIEQFGQEQVDEWYGQEVEFSNDGNIDYGSSTEEEYWTEIDQGMNTYDLEQEALWEAEELAWQLEEEAYRLEEEMYLAQMEAEELAWIEEVLEEELYQEEYLTDAEWYEIDIEEFGQEQVDEWYGEEVSFNEEGYIAETYWEEQYEEVLLTEVLLTEELYILEEAIGIEIFTEEEWEPIEENEIYEEVLEDYEREAIEEHEEEVFEEFEEEYNDEELFIEDEAFEDLIDEEELEELINEEHEEEFFREESEEEDSVFRPSGAGEGSSEIKTEKKSFNILIAQEEQVTQQAVSQDSTSSQAVVAEIDFGGTQEEQQTIAEVVQEQMDDGSSSNKSSASGSFDTNSFSTGSSSSGGGYVVSASQQEQITQATGDTFVMEQQEQSTGQAQIQVADIDDSGPAVSAFEVSEQQQDLQDEQQVLTFDDGSNFTVADQKFETSFDDALGAGQSIGQFLSNTAPTFAKFDIAPPTANEQNVSSAVESLADRMGSQVAAQNLQAQIQDVQQGGGFDVDQTATVAFIGYKAGFSEYTGQEQLSDKDDWYISKTLYKDNRIDDNKFSFYVMAGKTQQKLQEMIKSQYE